MYTCARCESPDVIRILRKPWLERLFGILGQWPFACVACGWTFLAPVCRLPAYRPSLLRHAKPAKVVRRREEVRVIDAPAESVGGLLALWHAITGQHRRAHTAAATPTEDTTRAES